MISVDEALTAVLANLQPLTPDTVGLAMASGRTLVEGVVSEIDVPPYTKSTMDGYAMNAADVPGVGVRLSVVMEILAGDVPSKGIQSGQAARIMTGAPIPAGANTVVRFEDTSSERSPSEHVTIEIDSVKPGQNVMRQGEVLSAKQTVMPAGKSLTGLDLGLIAEVTNGEIIVQPLPRIAVMATGNELVSVGAPLGPAQIRNSNGPMLSGLIEQSGGLPEDLGISRDDATQLHEMILRGLSCDALILSGGVSAGDLDLVPAVLSELGVEQVFHKVSLRPGKPLWFGIYNSNGRVVPVFGLPGNPVSSFVCFWLFVKPAMAVLSGSTTHPNTIRKSLLGERFTHRGPRETYFPGRIVEHGSEPVVAPLPWKGSADLATVTRADCLIRFPAGDCEFDAGQSVDIVLIPN